MAFTIHTHDSWGRVEVGRFQSLMEAQQAFTALCQDPWYRQDGGVKALELVEESPGATPQRLDWYAFR